MSIDGLGGTGKRIPPAPADAAAAPTAARSPAEAARAFELDKTLPVAGASVERTATSSLDQLSAGQIDLGRYLDLKVEEATAHLSALPRVELEAIRSALRDRLATDPALVDLVRTATGSTPPQE